MANCQIFNLFYTDLNKNKKCLRLGQSFDYLYYTNPYVSTEQNFIG